MRQANCLDSNFPLLWFCNFVAKFG